MTIIIKFKDSDLHEYISFDKITKLANYNEIIYIDCYNNNLI